ncbi:MAG: hypothetical protein ABSF34_13335 [Verrucomicrobiota bacterium]|jgi:hypothetical protein
MSETNFEPELQSLMLKILVEIESDRKEVEIRQKRISKNEALVQAMRGSLNVSNKAVDTNIYGNKAVILKNAIERITKTPFTQDDVEEQLKIIAPELPIVRDRIRANLWTLQSKGELIKQISKGNNRELAQFEKIPSAHHHNVNVNQSKIIISKISIPQRRPAFKLGAEKVDE